jgi:hypothetical protein
VSIFGHKGCIPRLATWHWEIEILFHRLALKAETIFWAFWNNQSDSQSSERHKFLMGFERLSQSYNFCTKLTSGKNFDFQTGHCQFARYTFLNLTKKFFLTKFLYSIFKNKHFRNKNDDFYGKSHSVKNLEFKLIDAKPKKQVLIEVPKCVKSRDQKSWKRFITESGVWFTVIAILYSASDDGLERTCLPK